MDASSFLPQHEKLEGEVKHFLFLEDLSDFLSHLFQFFALQLQEFLSKLDNLFIKLEKGKYSVLFPTCNNLSACLVSNRLEGLIKIVIASGGGGKIKLFNQLLSDWEEI